MYFVTFLLDTVIAPVLRQMDYPHSASSLFLQVARWKWNVWSVRFSSASVHQYQDVLRTDGNCYDKTATRTMAQELKLVKP